MNNLTSLARTALIAGMGLCVLAGAAGAQTVIGGYQAYIGRADLSNSRGAALTQPWQVVRQDRANVHRFGISQPGDGLDPWFGSGEMRTALENWVRSGAMDAATRAQIMAGGVAIYVEVSGQGSRASGVRVMLAGAGLGEGDFGGGNFGGGGSGGGDLGGDLGGAELIVNPE